MSTFEASYKPPLQGVSQQIPEERLPGQVTAQVNMLADPVTGLRRRPGLAVHAANHWEDAFSDHIRGWFTDIAGTRVHILVNTTTGNVRVLNESFVQEASLDVGSYLITSNAEKIRATSVGNEFFLANTEKTPQVQYAGVGADPANSGFFYIVAGAFSKEYNVSLVYPGGATTASYTTPSGAGAGDAALSTPEYIATQLVNQLSAGGTSNVTDVRILSWAFTNSPSGQLQKNIGTPASPAWVNVVANDEFSMADVANGKLQLHYKIFSGSGLFNVTYKTKVNGVWSTDNYTSSDVFLEDTEGFFVSSRVDASLFTTGLPTSGAPTLLVDRVGPYVYVSRSGGLSVTTPTGRSYLISSQGGFVTQAGDLPARLPTSANGFICRVGSGVSPQYYKYNSDLVEWKETSKYGSPSGITNVPISIRWTGSAWDINATSFEGRLAGDDDSNAVHEFMTAGITGMTTYQGRLVLLSGPLVSLSAAGQPRRFFRSTVTSLLNNDPIEIGSSMNSSAAYEWGVPFQKDLILFSRSYQAVIPSGNVAVTPATATVVPTSTYEVDTSSSPISIGRTLMYCVPKSANFFGVLEMVPSQYTDSQYTSQDSTAHLPRFMGGRCRFTASSNVASIAMFAPSGDKKSLIIHEYHWDGDQKLQQAWHQWLFEYDVAYAYFASDEIVVMFVQNEQLVITSIDPRAGAYNDAGDRRPFTDVYFAATITAHEIPIMPDLLPFDPAISSKLKAVVATGALAGELVGTTPSMDGTKLITVPSWPSGQVTLGIPFVSTVIPSPPVVRDYKQETIHTGKATVLRYILSVRDSSEFSVTVSDAFSTDDELMVPTLTFSNPELTLGRGLFANNAQCIVPCRTDLRTTSVAIETDGVGELNLTSIEYVAKYNPKIKRR
ncbi:MAG TPA: hypothetical protein VM783_17855 [Candidatus Acidoferrum sp.]|nr:hypothetical protein [Candidatus Acidoferrum sp.]